MLVELFEWLGVVCFKYMEYGLCGGVEFDGSCEVVLYVCVFFEVLMVRWCGSIFWVEFVFFVGCMCDCL